VAFISTQLKWNEATDLILNPSTKNGLKKQSLLRLSKLATIDKELAIGRLGSLNTNDLKQVDSNLKILLKL
jgi:mRNA interferase MazF